MSFPRTQSLLKAFIALPLTLALAAPALAESFVLNGYRAKAKFKGMKDKV